MVQSLILKLGFIRPLTDTEKAMITNAGGDSCYKYVVTEECEYNDTARDQYVHIPVGFLTDGSTGGPDYGFSWLFHDYLYTTHEFSDGTKCSRKKADSIMKRVLQFERLSILPWLFCRLVTLNPLWVFSRAWRSSGRRGAEFLNTFVEQLN